MIQTQLFGSALPSIRIYVQIRIQKGKKFVKQILNKIKLEI